MADDIRTNDAVTVKLFMDAGGIPIVRGNCPQSGLSIHTNNLLFGEALNPLNK